jgi:isoleucyl-tRNA synthetase
VERIKDVGNPWLDAGIVGISTTHYSIDRVLAQMVPGRLDQRELPRPVPQLVLQPAGAKHLMADGVGPFKNLFGYATLHAEDGREMHKSWGNMIEFNEAADKMGADTMRWLYASCKPEQNLRFGYHTGDETRRRFLIPLWNVYSFFVSYAQLDNWQPKTVNNFNGQQSTVNRGAMPMMDRWIVERLHETTLATRAALDVYDAEKATQVLEAYLDDLSNWYVRRSRRRFWKSEADDDKTGRLRHAVPRAGGVCEADCALCALCHRGDLPKSGAGVDDGAPRSVHHCFYPQADAAALDHRLLDKMRLAITTASLGRAARGAADVKLRQPLAKALVNVGSQQAQADLLELADVLQEEINVKEIEVVSEVGDLVDYKLLPNSRTCWGRSLARSSRRCVRRCWRKIRLRRRGAASGRSVQLAVGGEVVPLHR